MDFSKPLQAHLNLAIAQVEAIEELYSDWDGEFSFAENVELKAALESLKQIRDRQVVRRGYAEITESARRKGYIS